MWFGSIFYEQDESNLQIACGTWCHWHILYILWRAKTEKTLPCLVQLCSRPMTRRRARKDNWCQGTQVQGKMAPVAPHWTTSWASSDFQFAVSPSFLWTIVPKTSTWKSWLVLVFFFPFLGAHFFSSCLLYIWTHESHDLSWCFFFPFLGAHFFSSCLLYICSHIPDVRRNIQSWWPSVLCFGFLCANLWTQSEWWSEKLSYAMQSRSLRNGEAWALELWCSTMFLKFLY